MSNLFLKTVFLSVFLILNAILLSNCNKLNVSKDTPFCIKQKIKRESKNSCLSSVYEYSYNNENVYLFIYPCPEGCLILLNKKGDVVKDGNNNKMCSCTFGGVFCNADFEKNKTNERLIWNK